MSSNPYAPPQSMVTDMEASAKQADGAPVFFSVSQTKLLAMSLCTLGMYEYYWFYKNWRIIRDRNHENISPFWRAFFAIFYCHQLFNRVKSHDSQSSAAKLSASGLAWFWILTAILVRLPDPFWLVIYVGVLALLPVQVAINTINDHESPSHAPNTRFSAWNWVAVVLGGPFFVLVVVVTLTSAHG